MAETRPETNKDGGFDGPGRVAPLLPPQVPPDWAKSVVENGSWSEFKIQLRPHRNGPLKTIVTLRSDGEIVLGDTLTAEDVRNAMSDALNDKGQSVTTTMIAFLCSEISKLRSEIASLKPKGH